MEEVFKPLDYIGAHYLVGDQGTVYRNGELAHHIITPDGYHNVSAPKRSIGIHRLVAMCFVDGRTDEKNEVNHKDFNRTNNCADNLEWVTHAENIRYSARAGRKGDIRGEKNPNYGNRKLSKFYAENPEISKIKQGRPGTQNGRAKPVDVYKDGEFIAHFDILSDCCDFMNDTYNWNVSAETFRLGVRESQKHNRTYKGFNFKT